MPGGSKIEVVRLPGCEAAGAENFTEFRKRSHCRSALRKREQVGNAFGSQFPLVTVILLVFSALQFVWQYIASIPIWFADPSCVGGAREGREGRVW